MHGPAGMPDCTGGNGLLGPMPSGQKNLRSAELPLLGEDTWSIWGQYFGHSLPGTLHLPMGRQVVRLTLESGTLSYDWLRLTRVWP
jgi:hypothetical protein